MRLTWEKGQTLACRVYNRDFVDRNFAPQLPGIFTRGEAASDTLDKIEKAKGSAKDLEDGIAQLKGTLGTADASSGRQCAPAANAPAAAGAPACGARMAPP